MNLCIGGAAGDGIETMAGILEKVLHRYGFFLFSMRQGGIHPQVGGTAVIAERDG